MIVAKSAFAANKWTKLIGSKAAKKEYLALCAGTLKNKSGVESKCYVKIQKQNEAFSIISSYETKELQEIGVDEEDMALIKELNDNELDNFLEDL